MLKVGFNKHLQVYLFAAVMLLLLVQSAWAQSPPVFTSPPITTAVYNGAYTYSIQTGHDNPVQITQTAGTLPNGLTLTDNGDGTGNISGVPTEAGDFPVELTVAEVADGTQKDVQSFTISVAQASATVTLSNLTNTYNGTQQSVTAVTSPIGLSVDITYNGSATPPTNAGSYAVVATINDPNYTGTASGTLTINQATITATANDQSRTYGAANPTFTISYSGFVNGETSAVLNTLPSASTTANASSAVGTYSITVTGGTDNNYTFNNVAGTLTIAKAPLTADPDDQSKIYGAANPSLTISYTGFLNGDNASSITAPTASTTATTASPVGSYPITLTGGSSTNYTITLQSGTLTVTKAALTANADDQSRSYGAANPTLTITYTGFVNGDNAGSITEPSPGTTANATSGVGTYPITLTGGAATNYTLTLQSGNLTVTKAALTAKADDQSKIYATANPALTITYTGFVNGDNTGSITVPTASTTATAASAVGSYPINLTGGAAANYTLTLQSGNLTVTKASLTAKADDQSRIYGASNPTFTITYTGFVNGDNATSITAPAASTAATPSSAVGTYPITLTGGTAANYTFTYQSGNLTVTKAALTAKADDQSRNYGVTNPTLTITYTGFVNGDNAASITAPTASTIATTGSAVGSYPITLTGGTATNYTLTLQSGNLTVTKAGLTAIADDQSKIFGQANPVLTISYTGFVNGDNAASITQPTASTTATTASVVGTYPITLTGGSATNYTITLQSGTLTVTKATLTAQADDKSKVYGAANPAFTITYTGFVNGNTVASITQPTAGTTATVTSGVGTYPITLSGGSAANYNIVLQSGTLTVTPAALTAKADNLSKIYGVANPTFTITYTGFLNGDNAGSITAPTGSTTATTSSPVGSYTITLSGGSAANYTLTLQTGTLTVTKASLTAKADDQSKTFGAANPVLTISYTGFVNSDNAASITQPTASTTATTASVVGTYPITLTGGSATNYTLTLQSGTLTVTKALLTAQADDKSKVYGAANPTFTITYTGFVNGNTVASITQPTASTTATAASGVGTYPITLSGGSATNYNIVLQSGTLTITPAALTAKANNLSKTYGAANPTFTITYTGFLNGDNAGSITAPTASTTATAASPVGSYTITLAGGSAANYTLTLQTGTLTVTKAALTAKADDQTKAYGAANPSLTISYTGFVNGDDATSITAPTASTNVTVMSAVGSYPITLTGGSAVNYTLTLQNGTLTVTKATLTATAANKVRSYGAANPTLTINYTGFVNGDNATNITAPTASTTATVTSGVGDYPITLTGGSATNYNIVLQPGTLTISAAALTAKADNQTRTYGLANPTLTITYTGFVNGDNATSITAPTASTTASTTSAAGSYPITLTGGAAVNYTLILQSGTMTVSKAALTVKADNQTKVYGDVNPALTISYAGFVNGDDATSITVPSITTTATVLSGAGSYTITLSGGAAANYTLTLQNGTLTVTKASLIAKADNLSRLYGQANPTFTITYTGFLNGDNVSAITPPTASTTATIASNVGSYTITLAGGSGANYTVTRQNGTLTITKATPTVTWANPGSIVYGTPLGATQLNATADVPGTFVYTPASGTVLNMGANQTLSVNFTPSDAVNYNSVNGTTVHITVTKATPVITWSNPASITYGTALSATQLNATANVPGTFSYAPGVGTILSAGSNQALSVNFTPTDGTNYNSVNGTQVLITVNKATPAITWSNPAPISYGTPLGATQLNASSIVAGTFTYSPASGTVLNAGANQTLSVNFTPTDPSNYNSVNGTTVQITVNKATPVITWPTPAAITYGTALSGTQLNASTPVAGTFTYTPSVGTLLNAGANQVLSVDFTPTDGANYNSVLGTTRLLTVNKATPVISWSNPASITYGTALSATQLNATANVPGTFTYTPTLGAVLNTGTNQTLSVNFVPTDGANYNTVNGTTVQITVIKATPVVSWSTPLPIKVNVALSGTQLNATANVPGTFVYTPAAGTSFATAGTYTLSVNFTPTDGTNYNVVNNTQVSLTVNSKVNPVITWANPAAITYGTALSSTQLNATADVPGTFTYTPSSGTILNAGTGQTLSVNFVPTDGVNYNTINGTSQIDVNKALLTATGVNKSRVYGAANPALTITYTGFVNAETTSVINTLPTATCSAVAGSSAGSTFPIVVSGGIDDNYDFTYVNGTMTINKATLTAKADDKSRSYGLANPAFTITYTGFVNGDNVSAITAPTAGTTATTSSNVGTYPITVSGGSATNYTISPQSGTLTINISPLIAKADDKTKTYGQANPALTISYSGFLNGDNASSITAPAASTTATAGSGVGSYAITLTGGTALNYGLILQNGTMTVTQAPLTAKADDKTKTYGQANPALTITYTGFVNGDDATDITVPTESTAATTSSGAGAYPITLSGGTAVNYSITLQNGTLTINKASLTAKADDQTKIYGSTNPTLTTTFTGFVNGDNATSITAPTASTTATTASPVGTYAITLSGGVAANYTFVLTSGNLTITKAALTAKADDQNRIYGSANPTLTITYTGFVNGDNAASITAPTVSTAATVTSSVGSYPITLTGGSASNYTLTLTNGTLTIAKAALIAKADDQTKIFGQPNPTLTITYTGFVNGETVTSITAPAISTTATVSSPIGTYPITLTSGSAVNYTMTLQNGTLTITNAIPIITWANPAPITYGTALSSTQLNATANTPGTFTYTPAIGTILNVGANQTLSVNFSPTDATNYSSVNGITVQITVNKATPVITWAAPSAITYGTALGATQLNATANTPGTFTYTPVSGTVLNAGANQTLSVNFNPTDGANYNAVNGTTVQITVNKATPVITWANPADIIYGTALSGTQLNATSNALGILTYTPASGTVLSAGPNQALSVNFTPTDATNYNAVNGTTVHINVNKATPVITWANPTAITYGTPLNATQLNATTTVPGTFNYTPASGTVLNAGANQTLSVSFSPTDAANYNANNASVLITVNKATSVVTWANPTTITYGTPLSATQLNATANVPGTFTYAPASGTVLNAGANQVLSVNFTPTDAVNYTTVTGKTVLITVLKATPVITWSNPASITYGTALSATQLNATANVPGTFTYTPAIGTVLSAGSNQALSVNFTPTDGTNYNSVNGTQVLITVNKATPAITWSNPAPISYGTPLGATQLNASSIVAGTFTYSPASGTVLNAGANQTLSVNFTPTDPSNYNSVNGTTVQITVNKATPVITWPTPAAITYGTALSGTQLNASTPVAGTFTYTPSVGTLLNAGANQVLSVDFTPTDGANYNSVLGTTRLLTVNKATPVISWSNPASITYGTALSATQLNATANVPGTFTYTPTLGAVLNTGTNQTLSVNFVPTDGANYNTVNGTTVQITVIKATPVVSWSTPLPIKVNVALSGTQLNATANVPGTFVYTPAAGTSFATAGTYTLSVNFTPTDGTNYNVVNNTQVSLTVNSKVNPVITWANPAAITYGTALSSTQLNATADVPGTFTYTPSSGTILNAGTGQTLSVNFVPTDGVNYNTINGTSQIDVNKALLTATGVNKSRVYGAANPALTITYTGFVNAETTSVINTLPTATCSAVAGSSAGSTFPIVVSGGIDDNYDFTYVNGTMTINKATLTAKADDKSRSYGLANPAFTITYTGFVNGDNVSAITAPTAGTTATTSSNVGTYPITVSGGSATNYTISPQSGTLTINISPLIAKADDKTKTYGQANPALTISYSGFLNGDNASSITAPAASTTATAGSGVGSYAITLTGGTALNYGLILQNGTMTVTQAPLTAKADDKTKTYGQANPPNTITYTGFVNGDDATDITPPTISGPAATAASSIGTYPITLSGGTALNYDFTLQNGALTITKAPLRVNVQNKSRLYGQPNPTLTFTYVAADFQNGDNASSITAPTASTTATIASDAGTYPITATGTTLNYDFVITNGVLTVNKAMLTVKADAKSKIYGDPIPSLTATITGFVNGETISNLTTVPTPATVATQFSNVGTYAITASGGVATDYDFTYVAGTLTVSKALLTAVADNQSRLFLAPNPPLTISYSGFVNAETVAVIDTPPVATTSATVNSPVGNYSIIVSGGLDNNYSFNYMSGILSVVSSLPPVIADFSIQTDEDLKFIFDYQTFNQNFSGYPGDSIVSIKIVKLPLNGDLFWLGNKVSAGTDIAVSHGVIQNFYYQPKANYNGPDAITWNVFDGSFAAPTDAQIAITVIPVNDPPTLTNIETESILYGLGDAAVAVSKSVILNDIDNTNMFSAHISISDNYRQGDLLSLGGVANPKIISTFDIENGVLVLSGKDTRSNYEAALHNVLFKSPISNDTTLFSKTISIVVNDSIDDSNMVSRIVEITKVFPELSIVNAFTPNDDGVNDYWDFVNLQFYTEIKIAVFDQNGTRVFDCGQKDCKWDGKVKGTKLPAGPYFYSIDLDAGKRTYKGTVTILK